MYSCENRLRAVRLDIKLGKHVGLTTRQLGYPTENALKSWYREYETRHGAAPLSGFAATAAVRNCSPCERADLDGENDVVAWVDKAGAHLRTPPSRSSRPDQFSDAAKLRHRRRPDPTGRQRRYRARLKIALAFAFATLCEEGSRSGSTSPSSPPAYSGPPKSLS